MSNDIDTTGARLVTTVCIAQSLMNAARSGGHARWMRLPQPTAVVARFWTINHSEAAEGRDALTADAFERMWSKEEERIWAHPPPGILPDFADMLKRNGRKAEAMLRAFSAQYGLVCSDCIPVNGQDQVPSWQAAKVARIDDAPDRWRAGQSWCSASQA